MFYKFPERTEDERRYKHHEQVLPHIIGDTKARNEASTYIYRAPFKDKLVITKMLNEWSSPDLETTRETAEVIRPKAATVIKEWLTNAKEGEALVAEKFLTHLKKSKEGRRRRAVKSATFRRVFQRDSPRSEVNQQDTPRNVKCEHDIDRISKKRKEWRPQTSRPLTYGTYYPDVGYGNNTGVFNIVPNSQRSPPCSPTPVPQPIEPSPRQCASPARARRETIAHYPPPVNRSSIFSAVSLPSEQHAQYSQPYIENKPHSRGTGTYSGAGDAAEIASNCQSSSPSTKLKFSANMQVDGARDVAEIEHVMETESNAVETTIEPSEKTERRDGQNVNEGIHSTSKTSSPRLQNEITSYQYRSSNRESPFGYYFSAPPVGYSSNSRHEVGSAGRRRFPGRQYDNHFTLG